MAQENTRTQNTRTGTRTTPTTQMRQLGATVRLCSMLRRVYSSTGTPQRSHPCIERYPHSRRVCAVDVERSNRRYQPIPDA